ncbi:hypothetical protein [Falsiroseomonas sp.]|uniref:hypothetical protein n=1 Tax=Falsiroseomonas sp. TaxID=2870721 RepID=UPI003567A9C0
MDAAQQHPAAEGVIGGLAVGGNVAELGGARKRGEAGMEHRARSLHPQRQPVTLAEACQAVAQHSAEFGDAAQRRAVVALEDLDRGQACGHAGNVPVVRRRRL